MKVTIIEDEKLSAEHLTLLIQRIDISIEVVDYIDTVKGAIKYFKEGIKADLIFLDIHLADGNSFEIFNEIQTDIPIIFTTAFDNYAIQAFKQNSIDYLLKPISLQDLQFAIEKFKKRNLTIDSNILENLTNAYKQLNKQFKNRFLVKIGQTINHIPSDEIDHFLTQDGLTLLVTQKGNRYSVDYTLDQLEPIMDPKQFFRINRKIIISIKSIEKIDSYFNSRLAITSKLLNGDSRIVSRERVSDFKKWLDN